VHWRRLPIEKWRSVTSFQLFKISNNPPIIFYVLCGIDVDTKSQSTTATNLTMYASAMNHGISNHTLCIHMLLHRVLIRRRVSTIRKNRGSGGTCLRTEAGEARCSEVDVRAQQVRSRLSLSLSFSLSFSLSARVRDQLR